MNQLLKENKEISTERNELEEKCDALIKTNNNLQNMNDNLNKLTRGKFSGQGSKVLKTKSTITSK